MVEKSGKVLVVDDDKDVLLAARLLLKQHVGLVQTEKNPQMIPALIRKENYDVILLDMNFEKDASSGHEGFQWLKNILEIDPAAVVVMITAYGDVEMAVSAMKAGATDFVLKPWQNEKLMATVSSALSLRNTRREVKNLRSQQQQLSADLDQPYQEFIGVSQAIQAVFDTIRKVARTEANVLILGENGTGKELVARELHRRSARSGEVFISVDLGAFNETLFENELFGHVKGAFTDARTDRAGRFEIASGGTLFLDEIGNLPVSLQSKLLAVLENRQVTRLGSNTPIVVDVRLLCASNMPLNEMVEQQKFRRDLLYRINTVVIHIPPLRERREDVPLLAGHFLVRYARKYQKQIHGIHETALAKLTGYSWPGNVRELQHAVERAVIMCETHELQARDFLFFDSGRKEEEPAPESRSLEEQEKAMIEKTIARHCGNMSHAAAELGLSRPSLYRRLKKYGL